MGNELTKVVENEKRVKFTTTLAKDVLYKLGKLAPDFNGGDRNDVIENLVRREWDSREVEKERRNIK